MHAVTLLRALVVAVLLLAALPAIGQEQVEVAGSWSTSALYKGEADSIMPAHFTHTVPDAASAKTIFLLDRPDLIQASGSVDLAAGESLLTAGQLSVYNTTFNSPGSTPTYYGPLIQIPALITATALPFNKPGPVIDFTTEMLCGIYSGQYTEWQQLPGQTFPGSRVGPIWVIHHYEASDAAEILTRFLAANCGARPGTTLLNGTFHATTQLRRLFQSEQVPSNFIVLPTGGEVVMYAKVNQTVGAIGHTGTDRLDGPFDASRFAHVHGFPPIPVSAALPGPIPGGAAASNPLNWVPVASGPAPLNGYPIVGYSTFLLGQCYQSGSVADSVRSFLMDFYSGTHDTAILAHWHARIPPIWRNAIIYHFLRPNAPLAINDPNICNGIGRP